VVDVVVGTVDVVVGGSVTVVVVLVVVLVVVVTGSVVVVVVVVTGIVVVGPDPVRTPPMSNASTSTYVKDEARFLWPVHWIVIVCGPSARGPVVQTTCW